MTKFADDAFVLNDATTSGASARIADTSVPALTGGNNPLKGGNPFKKGGNPLKSLIGGKSKKVHRNKKSKGSRKNNMRKTKRRSAKR